MLDPATARLCVWRLPLEAAFRLFSKLGSLGGSIRERFSRTGRTRPALARPAFSRWLLENDRLRERWPCQWLNVLYFPFSEMSPFTSNVSSRPRAASVTISSSLSCWPRSASAKRSVRIFTNALCGAGRRRRNSAVFPASAAGQPTRRRRGGSSCSTSGRTGDLFSLLVSLFVSLFVVL